MRKLPPLLAVLTCRCMSGSCEGCLFDATGVKSRPQDGEMGRKAAGLNHGPPFCPAEPRNAARSPAGPICWPPAPGRAGSAALASQAAAAGKALCLGPESGSWSLTPQRLLLSRRMLQMHCGKNKEIIKEKTETTRRARQRGDAG